MIEDFEDVYPSVAALFDDLLRIAFTEDRQPNVVVTGSRYWGRPEYGVMQDILSLLPRDTILRHGDAPGVDSMAASIGSALHMTIVPHPAQWRQYGKAAGPKRNAEMISTKPDLVLAFHTSEESFYQSSGTRDCVQKALTAGCRVVFIDATGKCGVLPSMLNRLIS